MHLPAAVLSIVLCSGASLAGDAKLEGLILAELSKEGLACEDAAAMLAIVDAPAAGKLLEARLAAANASGRDCADALALARGARLRRLGKWKAAADLRHEVAAVRRHALRSAALEREAKTIAALRKALEGRDEPLKEEAARALAIAGDKRSLPLLAKVTGEGTKAACLACVASTVLGAPCELREPDEEDRPERMIVGGIMGSTPCEELHRAAQGRPPMETVMRVLHGRLRQQGRSVEGEVVGAACALPVEALRAVAQKADEAPHDRAIAAAALLWSAGPPLSPTEPVPAVRSFDLQAERCESGFLPGRNNENKDPE